MNLALALKHNRTLRRLTAPMMRGIPVENWPATAARLHGLNVPRLGERTPGSRIRPGASSRIIFRFLDQTRNVPGAVVECGVFRGSTLITSALYLKQKGIVKPVFGLDSFEGFGAEVRADIQLGGEECEEKRVGGFGATSYRYVTDAIRFFALASMVTLVPGFFKDSLPRLSSLESVSFLRLDCDLYESYKGRLDFFYPRLSAGAVVLMDEYADLKWPGAKKALDEFLLGKPEAVEMTTVDGYIKGYFLKQAEPSQSA